MTPIDANVIGIMCAVMVFAGVITALYYNNVTRHAIEREKQKQTESRLLEAIKRQEYLSHKMDQLEEQAKSQFDAQLLRIQPKPVENAWTQPPSNGEGNDKDVSDGDH